jgi:DNA-binding MarR family transcriptional regulator
MVTPCMGRASRLGAEMAETEQSVQDEYFLLWALLAQTKDAILRARERDLARYGITNDRRAVLYAIERNGGSATPVEISRNLFRELHSVTEMLKRMEVDGLITREKTSGRSRIVAKITEKGLDVFNESLHNETDKRVFSVLTKRERERLRSSLMKVRGRVLQDLGIPEWQLNLVLLTEAADEQGS